MPMSIPDIFNENPDETLDLNGFLAFMENDNSKSAVGMDYMTSPGHDNNTAELGYLQVDNEPSKTTPNMTDSYPITNQMFHPAKPRSGSVATHPSFRPSASPSENLITELSNLNLAIMTSASSIPVHDSEEVVSASSLYVDELITATDAFTCLLARLTPTTQLRSRENPNPNPQQREPSDISIILLVLACHQQLLAAFEKLCATIWQHLTTSPNPIYSGNSTSFLAGSGMDSTLPSPRRTNTSVAASTAQAVMVINLLGHLLGRLDQGLAGLAPPLDAIAAAGGGGVGSPQPRGPDSDKTLLCSPEGLPSSPASPEGFARLGMVGVGVEVQQGGSEYEDEGQETGVMGGRATTTVFGAAGRYIGTETRRNRETVQRATEVVKRLVERLSGG